MNSAQRTIRNNWWLLDATVLSYLGGYDRELRKKLITESKGLRFSSLKQIITGAQMCMAFKAEVRPLEKAFL